MKMLIINGSPRKGGDTASLIDVLKHSLKGSISEISAYYSNISPCVDCRACWQQKGCVIQDDVAEIYSDDFDVVVIASPIYVSGLPGPLVSLASRFQAHYAAKRFLKNEISTKKKTAALLLVGGGDGTPTHAINLAKWMFKYMNADLNDESIVLLLNTDEVPAANDAEALYKIEQIAKERLG